jgi:hypothetical protein
MSNGNVYKLIEIERHGGYNGEWFCYYKYKEECEPEANKVRWPDPKDRWYEGYLYQTAILKAIEDGVEFKDPNNYFKEFKCDHKWIRAR